MALWNLLVLLECPLYISPFNQNLLIFKNLILTPFQTLRKKVARIIKKKKEKRTLPSILH
jgi:hypothetical protein